jgi:predicted GNAT superfamily acetyltransferase
MVGFALSLPDLEDGHVYLYSHTLAVLPAYRNAGTMTKI